jgi:hypothetical protein
MDSKDSALTINRTAFSVVSLDDETDELRYWLTQTPEARILHVERLRRINYGHLATGRLQRVLEVAEFSSS